MINILFKSSFIFLVLVLLSGCSEKNTFEADYISTKPIPENELSKNFTKKFSNIKDEVQTIHIVWFIPFGVPLSDKEILDKITNKYDADLVTNIEIESDWWWAYLYGQYKLKVKADIWTKTKN